MVARTVSRAIERSTAFKRDYKREKKGRQLYAKPQGERVLQLARLGSHSELFG